ncbi:hypothetical protein GURASL_34780 [Geotalea uraniireducens]|uniref:DUF6916 domain-containing protein n=1 Tax=Geotalea uraniireducens TaxID=351604 RepID=A0ABM8EQ20_9BACT|nr:hypothetical protein [Geotalea uraniireducens]BDV44555.1 hypothetical protein GURASL_34780 [Geotalea uraniireducens]
MAGFRKEDFEPHIATAFEVAPVDMAPVTVELVEVSATSSAMLEGFSLVFKGSPASVFRHNTHTVRHPVMGEMALFLGPIHTGHTDAVYYQAVFSAPRER